MSKPTPDSSPRPCTEHEYQCYKCGEAACHESPDDPTGMICDPCLERWEEENEMQEWLAAKEARAQGQKALELLREMLAAEVLHGRWLTEAKALLEGR